MGQHVRALFTHDDDMRLLGANEPNGSSAPRIFLGRTSEGNVWRFRSDLPTLLIDRLAALCIDEPVVANPGRKPSHFDEYINVLETHGSVEKVWAGPAYRFPDRVPSSTRAVPMTREDAATLSPALEAWIDDLHEGRPLLAILQEGRAISLCCSVRITPEVHEAGVETAGAYRGKGYASEAVGAWANVVRDMGCIPLYSTSWENAASQGVAKKLGLVTYGVDFHVT